jgi:hypothetical protein
VLKVGGVGAEGGVAERASLRSKATVRFSSRVSVGMNGLNSSDGQELEAIATAALRPEKPKGKNSNPKFQFLKKSF